MSTHTLSQTLSIFSDLEFVHSSVHHSIETKIKTKNKLEHTHTHTDVQKETQENELSILHQEEKNLLTWDTWGDECGCD